MSLAWPCKGNYIWYGSWFVYHRPCSTMLFISDIMMTLKSPPPSSQSHHCHYHHTVIVLVIIFTMITCLLTCSWWYFHLFWKSSLNCPVVNMSWSAFLSVSRLSWKPQIPAKEEDTQWMNQSFQSTDQFEQSMVEDVVNNWIDLQSTPTERSSMEEAVSIACCRQGQQPLTDSQVVPPVQPT